MASYVKANGTSDPSGHLFWGGLKEFADGSLGSSTALFHDVYEDTPETRGIRTVETDALRDLTTNAHNAGLQVRHLNGEAFLMLHSTCEVATYTGRYITPSVQPWGHPEAGYHTLACFPRERTSLQVSMSSCLCVFVNWPQLITTHHEGFCFP